MDERFAQPNVRRLFPKWWKVEAAGHRSRPSGVA
jgi:hypothetical protein